MKKLLFGMILIMLGIGAPGWCLAGEGDAMPGMAAQGIVRLPHSGMVEKTFGAIRRPNIPLYQKSYQPPPRIYAKSREVSSSEQYSQSIEGRLGIDAKSQEASSSVQNHEDIQGRLVEKVGDIYLIATLTSDEPIRLLVDQDTIFITGPKSPGDLFKAQVTPNSNYAKIVW